MNKAFNYTPKFNVNAIYKQAEKTLDRMIDEIKAHTRKTKRKHKKLITPK